MHVVAQLAFAAAATAVVIGAPRPARADGLYFTEAFGVGQARGELEPIVGNAIHTRIAVGARVRWLAIEAWMGSDFQYKRDGAFKGLVGGDPTAGRADLEAYGVSLKAIAPLYRGPSDELLEGFVRGATSITGATGMLEGYRGTGFGASAGIQITGKVRALGFLWAPLFFLKKGPKVTGSLYLEQGWDFYRLRKADAPDVDARVGHVSVGFAIGSSF